MTLPDRISHFAKRRAYDMPDGTTLRMQPPEPLPKLSASAFRREPAGVFRLTRPVIGLPCLGVPTALYLHGRRDYIIGDTGKVHFTRCHRCPLKSLCQRMCEELLHHSGDAVKVAWQDFMDFGGWEAIVKEWTRREVRGGPASGRLRTLVQALGAAGVQYANDEHVWVAVERRRAEAKAIAAERQRRSRLARSVETDREPARDAVETAKIAKLAKEFQDRIVLVQQSSACPRWLVGMNARFAATVWAIRECKSARGERHGATHIACALTKRTPGADVEAMRKRVERVLKALPRLEALG